MVVGDDSQSIYAFRGATFRNIMEFPSWFPGATIYKLEENYRSTQPILSLANEIIQEAPEKYTKHLFTRKLDGPLPALVEAAGENAQSRFVAQKILELREEGVPLNEIAVLFRSSFHSFDLEIELSRCGLPFVKRGGIKFIEAAHVKDLLALMRWSQNLRDRVSGFRALQLLPGIGPKTAGRILENLAGAPAGCALLGEQPVPEAARENWQDFASLVESLGRPAAPWPACFEAACRWYEGQLDRLFDDAQQRQIDIDQLARMAVTYPSRERFLTELALDPPEATSAEAGVPLLDEDYLILSTIHSAKGQEWKAVTILNVVDGCIPSDMATGTPFCVMICRMLR
jgi:DNA helicase-2/ATP-dependent DNA helicase PcrA